VAIVLFAQQRGTLSGSVTDPTGAPIPNAVVAATEVRTGVKTTAIADTSGAYTMPFLPIGTYKLSGTATGFKEFVQSGIVLSAGQHPVIDIHLEIGR
jgi:hypothetical protein